MSKIISHERLRLLVYLSLTIFAFILLAAGISDLQLKTGEILFKPPRQVNIEDDGNSEPRVEPVTITSPQSVLGLLVVVTAFIVLYGAYRSPQIRAGLLTTLIFFAIYMGVIQLYRMLYEPPEQEDQETEAALMEQERLPEELFENPPDLVDWVSRATTLGIIAMTAVTGWFVWRQRERFLNRKQPLEIITDEVEMTLAELRAGANLRDAVMRCYYDMGQALRKGLGLVRQEGMTAREFEEVLKQAGLPGHSVQQLTRLFERVRYGRQTASELDKREAMACLEAIVQASAMDG